MDMQQDFNPRAPCGARQQERFELYLIRDFNPRAPCGARRDQARDATGNAISTHAPLAGRDPSSSMSSNQCRRHFNPRAPCGARLAGEPHLRAAPADFNPRAPCGARHVLQDEAPPLSDFNPRAPCGARPSCACCGLWLQNFNPRAPCGARHLIRAFLCHCRSISTHAPLAGRDYLEGHKMLCNYAFQPTRPLRGATGVTVDALLKSSISTHAPLAGRDVHAVDLALDVGISTHAPLAGRDDIRHATGAMLVNFNPRAPCGARPAPPAPP